MMTLTDLLANIVEVSQSQATAIANMEIYGLALDSRKVQKGVLFLALAGSKQHGLLHWQAAVKNGTPAILYDPCDDGEKIAEKLAGIVTIPVINLGKLLGDLAARFFDFPSDHLNVIGITGTNGKTSCSQFLAQVLEGCGLVGTLGWGSWGQLKETVNTTPDALAIQAMLAEFVSDKKTSVAMEVSSHGLDQGRVNGIQFKGAVVTNITRDHLDYHGTMEAYVTAKLKLLQSPGLTFAVVNLDDANCQKLLTAIPSDVEIWGVSSQGNSLADGQCIQSENLKYTMQGIEFEVSWQGERSMLKIPLFGEFNVDNIMCVLAVMLAMGKTLKSVAEKLGAIKPVPGRMERCLSKHDGLYVFVDYAHTPDALYRVLASVRQHCRRDVWVVFGCGGNRDTGKRQEMGVIAEQCADQVIITDDNPRDEDRQAIAHAILSGCKSDKVSVILDRKQAIQFAIDHARKDDCVVIAGKGHENYQEIKGVRYPFNDKAIAEDALKRRVAA